MRIVDSLLLALLLCTLQAAHAQPAGDVGSKAILLAKKRFEKNVNTNRRIVGGYDATFSEIPWQVGLVYSNDKDTPRAHFCGGTIISPKWIVTAAHCVDRNTPADWVQVFLGSDNLGTDKPVRISVNSIHVHEKWGSNKKEYDIALLSVTNVSSPSVPIRLPPDDFLGPEATTQILVSGWGATEREPNGVNRLQAVQVPVVTRDTCIQPVSYKAEEIAHSMFCAGETGDDSCQGDSGGPATVVREGESVLVGVVSWGYGCGLPDKFGVYTRIVSYLPWIRSQIASN